MASVLSRCPSPASGRPRLCGARTELSSRQPATCPACGKEEKSPAPPPAIVPGRPHSAQEPHRALVRSCREREAAVMPAVHYGYRWPCRLCAGHCPHAPHSQAPATSVTSFGGTSSPVLQKRRRVPGELESRAHSHEAGVGVGVVSSPPDCGIHAIVTMSVFRGCPHGRVTHGRATEAHRLTVPEAGGLK